MNEARRHLAIAGIAVLGLIGGVWTVLAPFWVGYSMPAAGGWTHVTTATVVTGGIVLLVSVAVLLVQLALAVSAATRARTAAEAEQ
jgi:hypothetical protein